MHGRYDTPITFNANRNDRHCQICGGSGVLDMSDHERPQDSVGAEYCQCQRPLLDDDHKRSCERQTRDVADRKWADDQMGAQPWYMNESDEELERVSEFYTDVDVIFDGFNVFEMIGVRTSWAYREPKESNAPFDDSFDLGADKVAKIRLSIRERALLKSSVIILNTSGMPTLSRQSASNIFKADIAEYRRAIAIIATCDANQMAVE